MKHLTNLLDNVQTPTLSHILASLIMQHVDRLNPIDYLTTLHSWITVLFEHYGLSFKRLSLWTIFES